MPRFGPPHFTEKGLGKFYNPHNRNLHGGQFNKPGIKQAGEGIAFSHLRSQYFRRAGMGAALRYTLGLEQVPSHVQDTLNSRQRRQTGLNPGDINVMAQQPESDEW